MSTHVVVPEPTASARLSTRRNRRRCLKDQVHQIWHAEITDWLENRDQCQTFGRDDKERAVSVFIFSLSCASDNLLPLELYAAFRQDRASLEVQVHSVAIAS
eukprot:6199112-Pleurochrysis_carterae.AAC.1